RKSSRHERHEVTRRGRVQCLQVARYDQPNPALDAFLQQPSVEWIPRYRNVACFGEYSPRSEPRRERVIAADDQHVAIGEERTAIEPCEIGDATRGEQIEGA